MPRIRSKDAVSVDNAIEAMQGTTTFRELYETLVGSGVNLGSQGSYLRRALSEACLKGRAKETSRGVFKFLPVEASTPHIQEEWGIYPEVNPNFVMPPVLKMYIPHLKNVVGNGEHSRFRVTGPKGCGKTEGGLQLAACLGIPAIVMDCSVIREPRDFFGRVDLSNGRTYWTDGPFSRAVECGNCLIILDELNRASDMVGNALLPLLDGRKSTLIQERGKRLKAGPGIIWWATTNVGSIYSGTNAMDAALEDRFQRIFEVTYLTKSDEADLLVKVTGIDRESAEKLVDIAAVTRSTLGSGINAFTVALSTRQLISAAHDLKEVGPTSLSLTIGNLYSPDGGTESERSQISAMLVGKFA